MDQPQDRPRDNPRTAPRTNPRTNPQESSPGEPLHLAVYQLWSCLDLSDLGVSSVSHPSSLSCRVVPSLRHTRFVNLFQNLSLQALRLPSTHFPLLRLRLLFLPPLLLRRLPRLLRAFGFRPSPSHRCDRTKRPIPFHSECRPPHLLVAFSDFRLILFNQMENLAPVVLGPISINQDE